MTAMFRAMRCTTVMKAGITGLAILVGSALPSFAADAQPQVIQQKMKQFMQKNPELMKEIMANPNHPLAMAYRQNLLSFARALKAAARQGDTVQPEVARTAVEEMKRSAGQLEKQQARIFNSLSEEKKAALGDIPTLIRQHLTDIRTRIDRLDKLAQEDTIASKAVMEDLQALIASCGAGMKGMHGGKAMMKPHGAMADVKAQGAELMDLVNQMNSAAGEKKSALMADIVTRLVKQRAHMNAHMDSASPHGMLQKHGPHCVECPCPSSEGRAEEDDEEDEEDDTE